MSGVPALALPKIKTSVGRREPNRARPGGMIDTGKHRHAPCLNRGFEPVDRILRTVAARYRCQSVWRHRTLLAIRFRLDGTLMNSFSAKELFTSPPWAGKTAMLFAVDATILNECPH